MLVQWKKKTPGLDECAAHLLEKRGEELSGYDWCGLWIWLVWIIWVLFCDRRSKYLKRGVVHVQWFSIKEKGYLSASVEAKRALVCYVQLGSCMVGWEIKQTIYWGEKSVEKRRRGCVNQMFVYDRCLNYYLTKGKDLRKLTICWTVWS